MNEDIRIDEGHILSDEDYIFIIRSKVNELLKLNYSNEVILSWEDNSFWNHYAKVFLNEFKYKD